MKILYLILLSFFISSCLGYKMARVYKPVQRENRIEGLAIKFDSTSFEHAMYQDRLKLKFITENKKTNSILYDFYYYKPNRFPIDDKSFYGMPSYVNTSLLDLSTFEMNYKHFLIHDDTLLFNKGLEGVGQYIKKTNNTQAKISNPISNSDKSNISELITSVPNFKYPKTYTNFLKDESVSDKYFYNKPLITYGDLADNIGGVIASVILQSIDEKNDLLSKHKIGSEITEKFSNRVIVQLHEFSSKMLPTISDSYKLIRNFTYNEIASPLKSNQDNLKGYIVYRIVEKDYQSISTFLLISSTLMIYIPNLIGYPIASQKINILLETTIYNLNNQTIKVYLSQGKGSASAAMYWGYGFGGAGARWSPNSMSRTANSKAIYEALTDLMKQVSKDKSEIERLLINNAR